MLEAGTNTGFIPVDPKPTDFIAGGESGALGSPVNPLGDWRPYYPANAAQLMKDPQGVSHGDTNACVSFAGCQDLETILNFQIKSGIIGQADYDWLNSQGYLVDGSVLLSKRFTAKMSGTIPSQGNSLPNVWNSMRNDGVVPDALWPMPSNQFVGTQEECWAIYYAEVPQVIKDMGQAFKARFNVQYEWILTPAMPATMQQIADYLKVSPLEIATAVCAGWNTDDPIKGCGAGTAHATMMGYVEGDRYDILDHYNPFQKQFASDYIITYGMRGIVSPQIAPPAPAPFHYTFTKPLALGTPQNDPTELHKLQEALQYLGYMKAGIFGPYGPQTQTALAAFQAWAHISDTPMGAHFGPKSRDAMNKRLA
jgi:hypothetical protein